MCRETDARLGGGEQVEIVEGRDNFAAGDEFLEIVATIEGAVAQDSLPESCDAVVSGNRGDGRLDHIIVLSSRCATVGPDESRRSGRESRWRSAQETAGWPTGLEPATARITIWSSTIELWPPSAAGILVFAR